MPIHIIQCRWHRVGVFVIAAGLTAASGGAQTARQVRGAPAVEPLPDEPPAKIVAAHPGSVHGTEPGPASDTAPSHATEPPAKIIIDAPQRDRLARGVVFVEYRTEHLRIVPVFGPTALAVSPRIGHIHVTVDDATWHWADASGNPVIVNGLSPGPHKILIQLVNADHQPIDQGTVRFAISQARQ